MFKSQERVRGMRLSEVVLLALTLATLVCVLVLLPARSAHPPCRRLRRIIVSRAS
jgi:hypothetical protein